MSHGHEAFYDATQACWVALFRRQRLAPAPHSAVAAAKAAWRRLAGTDVDPLDPVLGDPARNLYGEEAPRCTRCGVKYLPRPAGSRHPATWRVCRSCAKDAVAAARDRRGIRLLAPPAGVAERTAAG